MNRVGINLSSVFYELGKHSALTKKDFTFSISFQVVDYAPYATDWALMGFYPKRQDFDTGLFIRPFTKESWIAILVTTGVIILLGVIPALFSPKEKAFVGFQIMSNSGWYFFVLINAFYGGALTMFFSSEPDLPFQVWRPKCLYRFRINIETFFLFQDFAGAVDAFPSWEVLLSTG